jgi:2-keto-4-pentenoate hydratase/2-oxohepta-3-ene-1,7-dioic acid hydratase in catechol pathway
MKIVSYETPLGGRGVGMLHRGKVIDLLRALGLYNLGGGPSPWLRSLLLLPFTEELGADVSYSAQPLMTRGVLRADLLSDLLSFAARHGLTERLVVDGARLTAPIPRPPRIFALGLNYAAHAAEGGRKPPKEPIVFVKASTAVIGPEEPVICYQKVGRIDHEVELAVIIGREGRRISRAKAPDYIAGYTILNDITARDIQQQDMAASNPWFRSKSFDSFAPMGPCITLPDEIQEPCELDLSLRVNGELRQQSNTRDLIFKVPELIHWISQRITLEPGDVISTGTPAGIGPIQPGDVIEAEIERIGVLRNPVVAGR